jgi:hypothetical protein
MKVQRNWLKVMVIITVGMVFTKPVSAQISDSQAEALMFGTVGGLLIPALPVLADLGEVYALASLSSGVGVLYVGLRDESAAATYFGTAMILGGVYLIADSERKPSTQLLAHYGIWLVTGVVAAGIWDASYSFQPYVTPAGAGFRYTF